MRFLLNTVSIFRIIPVTMNNYFLLIINFSCHVEFKIINSAFHVELKIFNFVCHVEVKIISFACYIAIKILLCEILK